MTDGDDFAAKLAVLREQYAKQTKITLDDLVFCVGRQPANAIYGIALTELYASLHKLAGSGGTFGFSELSRQARQLEMVTKYWLDNSKTPEPEEWDTWKVGLSALGHTLSATVDNGATMTEAMPLVSLPIVQREHVRILLIEENQHNADELSMGLGQFGYEIIHCLDFATAERVIRTDVPDVLVVDIMLLGHPPAEALLPMFERLGYRLPIVFLTERMDFSIRLAAAQAGGGAFLTKPVDISTLAGRVEILLREREQEPYRVLIVDDDDILSKHYRLTLEAAGMLVETVCYPQETLEVMQHLNPDLLIIDLYMPNFKGSDLALAIRYEEKWMSLPIIYLSAESDLDEQIKALSNGGDDFITKPISDKRLVATVKARAGRARKISELMSQDSLTGLFKHSTIKDRLKQEVERSRRDNTVMAMAMVDLDHFKQVNDTWGHPMGDQVIKTLAHLLRQRLRRQDSIGRYGGEEFAVVLPKCTAEDAVHLLEDIRQRFSEIRFMHEGQGFVITLSAGIATSNQCADAQSLLAAADAALYLAKNNGRNQVRQFEGVAAALS